MHHSAGGAAIMVHVIPHTVTKIAQVGKDGTITMQVCHSETGGKANTILINFLAEILQVQASRMEIVAGQSSENKLITILDLEPGVVQERIVKTLST